ncbi:MAG: stage III sporulation protein AE, partial [Oscillospiraceae bacterium]|nr:stage III sporulation protein AE [Oscillospiraceae bacterium]
TVSAVICITAAAEPLCGCLERTADALETGQAFMAGYIPVFAGFLAAGGSVAGGAAYHVFVLFLTETVMLLANRLLFPLLQWGTALGIADAVNPKLRLGQFVSGFRTAVTWTLGTVMALFSALLSVRSFVASAADSLAAKSAKLLTSSVIPVIGSAVSDAYGTVQGSIILLRNSTGAVGILVIIWLTVPPLLSLLCYRAVFRLMQIVAETAGTETLGSLFRNAQTVLSAAFAILVCYAVMLIFSSAIMMILVGNR